MAGPAQNLYRNEVEQLPQPGGHSLQDANVPSPARSPAAGAADGGYRSRRTGGKLLAVLDFDKTLACEDVSFFDLDQDDVCAAVFGGEERFARLNAFLLGLASNGVLLAIVSFNSAGLIRRVLQAAQWVPHFGNRVFGLDEVHRYNSSKGACISHELVRPLRIAPEDVIFVDDSANNCRSVKQIGAMVVHVNRGGGMGEPDFAAVLEWLSARAQPGRRSPVAGALGALSRRLGGLVGRPRTIKELPV
ncbi:hypothetical protein T492DRAFT_1143142 [Pavlovales sp. CCMP2436]|nr:hypothetical protein T492DRAFT_1143142 [Pavlovales sp. CCMP2436]